MDQLDRDRRYGISNGFRAQPQHLLRSPSCLHLFTCFASLHFPPRELRRIDSREIFVAQFEAPTLDRIPGVLDGAGAGDWNDIGPLSHDPREHYGMG